VHFLSRHQLFQPLLKHAGVEAVAVVFAWVDLAAPAWVVSLVHVLELPILAAPVSLVREEWVSLARVLALLILLVPALLAPEEWLSPEQGLAESGPAEALG
jgi:hypothetical protein